MATRRSRAGLASLLFLAAVACAPKKQQVQATVPLQPKQNLIVLLPDPESKTTTITITNSGGAQTLNQPYQAIRVERSDTAPTEPFAMNQMEVRRVFGSVLDALPAPAAVFTLYFGTDSEVLLHEEQANIPKILNAIQERRSSAIYIIGHTDTTANQQFNYQLGLRRAEGVAAILRARGVDSSAIIVSSHGQMDLAVKTGPNVSEHRNRRVEVMVE